MTLARRDRGSTIAGQASDPGNSIRVLYETDDLIAIDKPEGVVSVATAGLGGLPELVKPHYAGKLYPVHRLDRGASGVILFAKTAAAHRDLNGQFDRREVRKTYLAAVDGVPASNRGQIKAPLREFGSGRMGVDAKRGKPATTGWKIVERLEGAALLRVSPATGRRHQIRVHLYHIGHPILGDLRYGDKARQARFPRLMLHALSLEFARPSGESVTVEAPPPASFERVVASLRRPRPSAAKARTP
jgi:tRNA pseudouridine32 synthase/23S rRNA pseudouridine746 synthase